ncbi:PASTA domain-containing protein [Arthrobacter sp. Hiyo6]|nr:PASTA domain-containing protein [Arthrobacter sp. Hiyo6]
MTSITMTLSSPEVELKNGKGSLAASVTNAGMEPERVVLGAFPSQAATPAALHSPPLQIRCGPFPLAPRSNTSWPLIPRKRRLAATP